MKKKIYFLTVLSVILFLLTFQSIGIVTARTESFTDPENDVYRVDIQASDVKKGDYHDEIDITSIAMVDNYFNATFAAPFVGADIVCDFFLYEYYDPDTLEYGIYAVKSSTGLNDVYFVHYVPSGQIYLSEVWTGGGWSFDFNDGATVGSMTGNLVEGTVPEAAWTVPDNVTWYVHSLAGRPFVDVIIYADYAPKDFDPYPSGDGDEIPGYSLSILISALFGISIYIIIKKIKKR